MVLGISEDYTSQIVLDSQLRELPASGLFLNSGVHPSITTANLLKFLPTINITFAAWNVATAYGVYESTRNYSDIVLDGGKIFQCIKANTGDATSVATSWLETNIESLRIKNLLYNVEQRVYSDLNLNKQLVENQYLYEDGDSTFTLPEDYSAWVLQAKNSDYISFRINQISVQRNGTTPVNIYLINQGILIKTITVAPANGSISFVDVNEILIGKGKWLIAVDSGVEVYSGNTVIDSLSFDGFTAHLETGIGNAPETAKYSKTAKGNGIGMNITVSFSGKQYIDNNVNELAYLIRSTFEYFVFQMFLHNSNNVSSRESRIQMNSDLLMAELKNLDIDSVVSRYHKNKSKATRAIKKSFDAFLTGEEDDLNISIGSI